MAVVSATAASTGDPGEEHGGHDGHVRQPALDPPTRKFENRTNRLEIPPVSISAPANMKNGIAIIGKESTPANIRWTTSCGDSIPLFESSAIALRPRLKKMGALMIRVKKNRKKKMRIMATSP